MENVFCNASSITHTMLCCVGETFSNLVWHQLSNRTELFFQMEHCFPGCGSSSSQLLKQTMKLLFKADGPIVKPLHECPSLEGFCTNDMTLSYLAVVLVLVGLFLFAFLGNIMVIVSILLTRKLRNLPSGMFILSLAFSDFFVSVFIVPLKLRTLSHNLYFCDSIVLCRAYITLDNILFVASITNLFVLTVDRYLSLQYGFGFTYTKLITKRRVRILIVGVWVYAAAWGIAANIDWTSSGSSIAITQKLECVSTSKYYITVVYIFVFYFPIIIMGYLYHKIHKIANRQVISIKELESSFDQQNSPRAQKSYRIDLASETCSLSSGLWQCVTNSPVTRPKMRETPLDEMNGVAQTRGAEASYTQDLRSEKFSVTSTLRLPVLRKRSSASGFKSVSKATKTVGIVCGCFLLCWLPVSILSIGVSWSAESFETVHTVIHVIIVEVLPVLNSTLNPFIYFIVNSTYRKALRMAYHSIKNRIRSFFFV